MMLRLCGAMMYVCPLMFRRTHHQRSGIIGEADILCPTGQTSLKKALACASAFFMAEKEGFEPSRRLSQPTPLAGEPLRPLGYFSIPDFRCQSILSHPRRIVNPFSCKYRARRQSPRRSPVARETGRGSDAPCRSRACRRSRGPAARSADRPVRRRRALRV